MHLSQEAENKQGMGVILDLIKNDPLDNHARSINDILPDITLNNNPQLDSYLTARIL